MHFTNILAAALIAFSGFAAAMPTASADIADIATNINAIEVAHDEPPRGYGNDHRGDRGYNDHRGDRDRLKPWENRFCDEYTHGHMERQCREDFKECEQKSGQREQDCRNRIQRKYEPHHKSKHPNDHY